MPRPLKSGLGMSWGKGFPLRETHRHCEGQIGLVGLKQSLSREIASPFSFDEGLAMTETGARLFRRGTDTVERCRSRRKRNSASRSPPARRPSANRRVEPEPRPRSKTPPVKLAAKEGTTVRALFEAGLRTVLAERRKKTAPFKLRLVTFRGDGLHAEAGAGDWERLRELVYEGRGT